MKDVRLHQIAKDFRKGMLGERQSALWCFALSAPLASYLQMCGYECVLTKGYIGKMEHVWITLSDGRILDPTAEQFDTNMPEVYLGKKPRNYKVKYG